MSGKAPSNEGKRAEEVTPQESIAAILARAEANNPLPHMSGSRGFSPQGPGRRSGRLTRGTHKRERAHPDALFGIKKAPEGE